MFIFLSLAVCLVGLFMYFAAKTNADVKAVGYVMFAMGLLAFLLTAHGSRVLGFLN